MAPAGTPTIRKKRERSARVGHAHDHRAIAQSLPWFAEKGADSKFADRSLYWGVLRHWGLLGGDPYGASRHSRAQGSSRD